MKQIKNFIFLMLILVSNCSILKVKASKNITDTFNCAINPTCLLNTYYLITRLKKTITLLHKIPKKLIQKLPFDQLTYSSHPTVEHIIIAIKKEKNLHTFFMCWYQITTDQIITDEPFFIEFATLTCKILCLITQATLDKSKASTLENILSISQKIDRLPLSEILNTIDMLTYELPLFLEKYEFNSAISWNAWLKKYWWVPPVIIFWFGLKILIKFQRKPSYVPYGYFPQPVPTPILTNDPALLEIMRKQETISK